MNNQELYELFKEANTQDSFFDTIIFLKKHKRQYKTSVFYKSTHYSIWKSYRLFQLDGLNTLATLFTNRAVRHLCQGDFVPMQMAIEQFIEDLDLTQLEGMLNIAAEKLNAATEDKDKLKEELQDVINNLKIK